MLSLVSCWVGTPASVVRKKHYVRVLVPGQYVSNFLHWLTISANMSRKDALALGKGRAAAGWTVQVFNGKNKVIWKGGL